MGGFGQRRRAGRREARGAGRRGSAREGPRRGERRGGVSGGRTGGATERLDVAETAERKPVLSESLQDYLEAVYVAAQRHGVARMKEIASQLGVAKSSVTAGIQALAERDLVNYDPYQYVTLTARGESLGRELVRRHRVLKRFLMRVLSVPEPEADAVACRLEHALKGEVFERFVRFVQFVETRPAPGEALAEGFRAFCTEETGGAGAEGSGEAAEVGGGSA